MAYIRALCSPHFLFVSLLIPTVALRAIVSARTRVLCSHVAQEILYVFFLFKKKEDRYKTNSALTLLQAIIGHQLPDYGEESVHRYNMFGVFVCTCCMLTETKPYQIDKQTSICLLNLKLLSKFIFIVCMYSCVRLYCIVISYHLSVCIIY